MIDRRPTLNPALREFWATPARYRVLYGGRASSKSWDAAGFAVFLAQYARVKFMCCRQFQNRISDSVYELIKVQIERFGLQSQFKITDKSITNTRTGSEFVFYGLARNYREVKSAEGFHVLWIEEADFLTEDQARDLFPTFRAEGSQIWLVFNPRLATDYVWREFVVNPPANAVVRHINYTENPFLSDTMLAEIETAKARMDELEFRHIYLGHPNDNDDDSVIKRSWLLSCIDAHIKLGIDEFWPVRLGYDVADSGQDKNAAVISKGGIITNVEQWQGGEDDLLGSCERVYRLAVDNHAHITYDGIGVGAFVGSKLAELNKKGRETVAYKEFIAGGKVERPDELYFGRTPNRDYFSNVKAQSWWGFADRVRETHNAITKGEPLKKAQLVSFCSDVPDLHQMIDELSSVKRRYDDAGKVKVESKSELAKRGIRSPNIADAVIMSAHNTTKSINYGDLL